MVIAIPAKHGAHAELEAGQYIRIINPPGTQVVDAWAFATSDDVPRWMSMSQTRSKLRRALPMVNDTFIDTHREPILTLVDDTSSGVHDLLFPSCDYWRYAQAGAHGHASCAGNLRTEMAAFVSKQKSGGHIGPLVELEEKMRIWGWTPEPLNLFMNVPVSSMEGDGKGEITVKRPNCRPGAFVVLRAEAPCVVVMSACPNDLMDTNAGKLSDAAYEVLEAFDAS